MNNNKKIEVIRKKETDLENGPKIPQKKKVLVLRKAKQGENYIQKDEIPVSIGIEEYYNQMKLEKN